MAEDTAPPALAGEDLHRRDPRPGGTEKRLLAAEDLGFAPSSYDAGAGTVNVVWSTGAAVRRYDWRSDSYYMEELDLRGADLTRLQSGGPVLADHWSSVDSLVGSVVPGSVRVDAGRGTATIRFDRTSEAGKAVEAKVAAGHLRHVSIGYQVQTWDKVRAAAEGQPDRYIARAWSPFEISFVPVPADAGAGTRGARGAEPSAQSNNRAPVAPNPEVRMTDKSQDTGAQAPEGGAPAPAATVNAEEVRKAERLRAAEIRKRARALQLGDDFTDALIEEGLSLDAAATRMVDELAKRSPKPPAGPTASVGEQHDDPVKVRDAMAEAIAIRIKPDLKISERAAQYRGLRPSELLRDLFAARGERAVPRDIHGLAAFAFGDASYDRRSFHTTSDYPLLLGSALNKVLLADYQQATPTYRRFMAQRSFNDFRAHSFLRAGDFPVLEALGTAGEIKYGTISEGREQVTAAIYAKGFGATRAMLINDELGAFSDFAAMAGRRVLDFENATAFAVLAQNSGAGPTLSDSTAVFSTSTTLRGASGNRASSGGAIGVDTLTTGVTAMAAQTSPDGLKLNLMPRYLLTGTAYMVAAKQVTDPALATQLGMTAAAGSSGPNPFSGVFEPIWDANVSGNRWYLLADPAVAPCFIWGYVAGQTGPQVRTGSPMGRDGFQVEVVLDFGCGAIDWRGGWFNAGA